MRKKSFIAAIIIVLVSAVSAYAAARRVEFRQPLVFRGDATGNRSFADTIRLEGLQTAKDGAIVSTNGGKCELTNPIPTTGIIYELTANWQFSGVVTLEVSATGNPDDYVPVVCGVPLEYGKFVSGSQIKWRSKLGPESTLSEVKISYKDLTGVVGSFGSELLSGFEKRHKVFIKGSAGGDVFNYQIPITIGESDKVTKCDFNLNGGSKSGFSDIRFTAADGETALPYYIEEVTGTAGARTALCWVKVPQIPKDGLPIYIYYGSEGAVDLSDGSAVFDFFDDFGGNALDTKKWKFIPDNETGTADVAGSTVTLNMSRINTLDYKFKDGILEYRALLSDAVSAVAVSLNAGAAAADELTAYSSTTPTAAFCIARGQSIKANDAKPVMLNTYCDYRLISTAGSLTFQRYADNWQTAVQAQVKYSAGNQTPQTIGFYPGAGAKGVSIAWVRTREYVEPAPLVDTKATVAATEEATNLPEFANVVTAKDGTLRLADKAQEGYYISHLVSPAFKARLIKAYWESDFPADDLTVGVSTQINGKFYTDWTNGIMRYASKKEFVPGNKLRWKAEMRRQTKAAKGSVGAGLKPAPTGTQNVPALKGFGLEFYPGTIRVTVPNGKEAVKPGARYDIYWEADGYEPKYPLNIYYSADGGDTYVPVTTKAPNSGSYTWYAPKELTDKALIKVADAFDTSIFDTSDNYFSVSEAGASAEQEAPAAKPAEETKPAEAAAEKPAPVNAGLQLYELLVMNRTNTATDKAEQKRGLNRGDIVMIKPGGYLWGAAERQNFTIIKAYLTEEEARELMRPQETRSWGRQEVVKERRYRIDLDKKGLLQKQVAQMKGLTAAPVIEKTEIIDKSKE